MFTCPRCSQKSKRLIGTKDGIYCSHCYQLDVPRPMYLHERPYKGFSRLTEAKCRMIDNRIVRDGIVIDRRTGKPTER